MTATLEHGLLATRRCLPRLRLDSVDNCLARYPLRAMTLRGNEAAAGSAEIVA
jgi:hypothetical protein